MEASTGTGTELSSWRIFGMATNKNRGYNHQPRPADVWLLRALPRASVRAVWIKEGACALGPEWQEVDGRATSKIPDGFTSYKQARAGWVGGWVGGDWRGLEAGLGSMYIQGTREEGKGKGNGGWYVHVRTFI